MSRTNGESVKGLDDSTQKRRGRRWVGGSEGNIGGRPVSNSDPSEVPLGHRTPSVLLFSNDSRFDIPHLLQGLPPYGHSVRSWDTGVLKTEMEEIVQTNGHFGRN